MISPIIPISPSARPNGSAPPGVPPTSATTATTESSSGPCQNTFPSAFFSCSQSCSQFRLYTARIRKRPSSPSKSSRSSCAAGSSSHRRSSLGWRNLSINRHRSFLFPLGSHSHSRAYDAPLQTNDAVDRSSREECRFSLRQGHPSKVTRRTVHPHVAITIKRFQPEEYVTPSFLRPFYLTVGHAARTAVAPNSAVIAALAHHALITTSPVRSTWQDLQPWRHPSANPCPTTPASSKFPSIRSPRGRFPAPVFRRAAKIAQVSARIDRQRDQASTSDGLSSRDGPASSTSASARQSGAGDPAGAGRKRRLSGGGSGRVIVPAWPRCGKRAGGNVHPSRAGANEPRRPAVRSALARGESGRRAGLRDVPLPKLVPF